MKELIIIGAGGMGRTLYCNAMESIGYGEVFRIKGFLDDNAEALAGYEGYPPILGAIKDYQPCPEDVFASSLGGSARRPCIEEIIRRGGEFLELIHKTARIYQNVKLGKGNFIGAYSVLGNDAVVGDFNMIQSYTVIGHDVRIGNWNRLDTHVTCVGGIVIEDETTIHTSAVINHGITVGSGAHVGALSFVIRNVKPCTTVFGNPAKMITINQS